MAIIACIGWGSLIWRPETLPIQRHWFEDGPFLPVEFARESKDGRITLVICADRPLVRTLWAIMDCATLDDAVEALRIREGIFQRNTKDHIGIFSDQQAPNGSIEKTIGEWALSKKLSGAVWTALPPKFGNREEMPSEDEVIAHFRGLRGSMRDNAIEYVECAPRQIDTPYRRRIEAEFGRIAQNR